MTKLNPEVNLASLSWVPTRFLVKLEMMNISTYLVVIRNFNWAGTVIFWAWHQNRSGILQVDTKYDYTEITNCIWPLFTNFTQSIPYASGLSFLNQMEWSVNNSTPESCLFFFLFFHIRWSGKSYIIFIFSTPVSY